MIKIIFQKRKNLSTQSGYAALELIFYITFFVVLAVVVINAMITMAKSFKETTVQAELIQSGSIMEKVSRDIRQANDFSYVANVLTVNTKDEAGNAKTITYTFSPPNVGVVDSSLGNLGNLNTSNITIINFNFNPITTAKGKAVTILITVKSNNDINNRTFDFNNTVVLRGDY